MEMLKKGATSWGNSCCSLQICFPAWGGGGGFPAVLLLLQLLLFWVELSGDVWSRRRRRRRHGDEAAPERRRLVMGLSEVSDDHHMDVQANRRRPAEMNSDRHTDGQTQQPVMLKWPRWTRTPLSLQDEPECSANGALIKPWREEVQEWTEKLWKSVF